MSAFGSIIYRFHDRDSKNYRLITTIQPPLKHHPSLLQAEHPPTEAQPPPIAPLSILPCYQRYFASNLSSGESNASIRLYPSPLISHSADYVRSSNTNRKRRLSDHSRIPIDFEDELSNEYSDNDNEEHVITSPLRSMARRDLIDNITPNAHKASEHVYRDFTPIQNDYDLQEASSPAKIPESEESDNEQEAVKEVIYTPVPSEHIARVQEQLILEKERAVQKAISEEAERKTMDSLVDSLTASLSIGGKAPFQEKIKDIEKASDYFLIEVELEQEMYLPVLESLLGELINDEIASIIQLTKKRTPLSAADKKLSMSVMQPVNASAVRVTIQNAELTARDFQTLKPLEWLNDEIINSYFTLLQSRNDLELNTWKKATSISSASSRSPFEDFILSIAPLQCHFFSSYFYVKLYNNGNYAYKGIARWTRNINIFEYDRIFMPVHVHGNHWCCGVLHMKEKKIIYYDSLRGENRPFFTAIRQFLKDEAEVRFKQSFKNEEWENITLKSIPMQNNGSDCGVFTCKFADYLSDKCTLDFDASYMCYFRERMAAELKAGCLL